ncbi:MAG TPA: DUF3830 family protein [Chloroflexota bacterium]
MEGRRIVLTFPDEDVSVEAVLLDDQAPRTCAAVWEHLPSSGFARHGIYSGSEVYALWERPFVVQPENQTSDVLPGDIAYYFQRGGLQYGFPDDLCEMCWFYDRDATPSMPGGPVQVNLFARVIGDPALFFAVCRRMRLEGHKRFRVLRFTDAESAAQEPS